jgi:osmotically-inducible protein OsmY
MQIRVFGLMAIFAIALGMFGVGCQPADETRDTTSPGIDTPGDDPDRSVTGDAATTGMIRSALLADTEVGALDINVDTLGDVVYLKGSVESEAQKDRAEEIAGEHAGDRTVRNELTVDPN